MPAPRLEAVLFDHDGTLVDSEIAHFRMWVEVLAPFGVALTEDQYHAHYAGIPTLANATDMVARFGLAVGAAELADAKVEATRAFLAREPFPLMPGARETIADLARRGLRLAVVTGAGRHGVDTSLRLHGLTAAFECVVSGDDVRRSKPAPDCYLLALRQMGIAPQAGVAIEDTGHGAAAAMGAGLACLAVPTPMSRRHDFAGASGVFASLHEAGDWVRRRLREAD